MKYADRPHTSSIRLSALTFIQQTTTSKVDHYGTKRPDKQRNQGAITLRRHPGTDPEPPGIDPAYPDCAQDVRARSIWTTDPYHAI